MSILLLTIKLKLRLTVIFDLETRTVKFWTWNQNKSLIRLKLFLFIRFFMSYFRVASKAWNVWVFFLKKNVARLQNFKTQFDEFSVIFFRFNGRLPTCYWLSGLSIKVRSLFNTDGCVFSIVFLKFFSFLLRTLKKNFRFFF